MSLADIDSDFHDTDDFGRLVPNQSNASEDDIKTVAREYIAAEAVREWLGGARTNMVTSTTETGQCGGRPGADVTVRFDGYLKAPLTRFEHEYGVAYPSMYCDDGRIIVSIVLDN